MEGWTIDIDDDDDDDFRRIPKVFQLLHDIISIFELLDFWCFGNRKRNKSVRNDRDILKTPKRNVILRWYMGDTYEQNPASTSEWNLGSFSTYWNLPLPVKWQTICHGKISPTFPPVYTIVKSLGGFFKLQLCESKNSNVPVLPTVLGTGGTTQHEGYEACKDRVYCERTIFS